MPYHMQLHAMRMQDIFLFRCGLVRLLIPHAPAECAAHVDWAVFSKAAYNISYSSTFSAEWQAVCRPGTLQNKTNHAVVS